MSVTLDSAPMTARDESDALHRRVQRYIADSLANRATERFDDLACDLARFQARWIEPVRRCHAAQGIDAETLRAAERIPALPTDVFRLRRVAAHAASEDVGVFETSGTSQELSGRHPFRSLGSYVLGARAWALRMLWPDGAAQRLVMLAADPSVAPRSSLSYMLAHFAEIHGTADPARGPLASWHWDGARLDVAGVLRAIDDARHEPHIPVTVAGTSFAFVHLCDAAPRGLALPPNSRVMQTGGFKGRSREVDAAELRARLAAFFEVPETHVVGEYGMTELSSQLYQATLAHALGEHAAPASATAYYPPPWLRASAVDPVTLAPLGAGHEGIGRIVDLANVDSAVAIQTADRIVAHDDGSIELLGRMPGAPPRGCSLAIEHVVAGHD